VGLREYVDAHVVVRRRGATGAGPGATREVNEGDTLFSIAQEIYGDSGRWKMIATANAIASPRELEAGTVLIIPPKDAA
jgi:nucleoid-associated protein YgaU